MKSRFYNIGGVRLEITMPSGLELTELLPNYKPFMLAGSREEAETVIRISDATPPATVGMTVLDDSTNDLGHVILYRDSDGGYLFELRDNSGKRHTMQCEARFGHCEAQIDFGSTSFRQAIDSLIRIAYSQAVLLCGGISIHASAVTSEGKGYLFLGASGTGKSTHSRLWLKAIAGSRLLNDDNPIVTMGADGSVIVHGTPWSGKTPCYKNESAPVAGIVRLRQSATVEWEQKKGADAFGTLLPSCSVIKQSAELFGALCRTSAHISGAVAIGELGATLGAESAIECKNRLDEIWGQKHQEFTKN